MYRRHTWSEVKWPAGHMRTHVNRWWLIIREQCYIIRIISNKSVYLSDMSWSWRISQIASFPKQCQRNRWQIGRVTMWSFRNSLVVISTDCYVRMDVCTIWTRPDPIRRFVCLFRNTISGLIPASNCVWFLCVVKVERPLNGPSSVLQAVLYDALALPVNICPSGPILTIRARDQRHRAAPTITPTWLAPAFVSRNVSVSRVCEPDEIYWFICLWVRQIDRHDKKKRLAHW